MSVGISWGPAAAKLGLFKFTMFWAMEIIVPTLWTGFSHKYYASPYQTRLDKNLSTREWKHSNIWESLKIKAFYIAMNYAGIFNSPEMEDENQNGSLLKRNSLYDSHSIFFSRSYWFISPLTIYYHVSWIPSENCRVHANYSPICWILQYITIVTRNLLDCKAFCQY